MEENGSLFLLIVLSEKTTLSRQDLSFQFVFQEVISLHINLSHKVFQFSCFRKGHQWASCEGIKPTEIWSHMLEVKQMLISICKILSFFYPSKEIWPWFIYMLCPSTFVYSTITLIFRSLFDINFNLKDSTQRPPQQVFVSCNFCGNSIITNMLSTSKC